VAKANKHKTNEFLNQLKDVKEKNAGHDNAKTIAKKTQKADTIKFVSSVLSFACIVIACIFLMRAPLYLLIIAVVLFGGLGVSIAFLEPTTPKRESIFKSLFIALIASCIIFVTYISLRATGVLDRLENAEQVASAIRGWGFWGIFAFIFLIILNTVFLPIPFAVPAVIGALVFGPLMSFVYMSIGLIIGSLIVFSLGKRFGRRLVEWVVGKEKTEKYARFLDKKGRLAFIFMMIFPFFPDDILCLIAGMSNMSYKFFIFVICTVRACVLAFTSFFASGQIIPFSGWGIPVWITIGVLLLGIFIIVTIVKKRINKSIN